MEQSPFVWRSPFVEKSLFLGNFLLLGYTPFLGDLRFVEQSVLLSNLHVLNDLHLLSEGDMGEKQLQNTNCTYKYKPRSSSFNISIILFKGRETYWFFR